MAISVNSSVTRWAAQAATGVDITSASFSPAANSLLVLLVNADTVDAATSLTMAVTGGSLTWTNRGQRDPGDGSSKGGHVSIWTAPAPAGTSLTISVNRASGGGGSNWLSAKCYVVTGQHATAPIGAAGEGSSATNNLSPTLYTSTANNSRAIYGGNDWANIGTATSTDTADAAGYTGALSAISVFKAADTATSGTSVSGNLDAVGTGAAEWNWVALEILPAASGGAVLAATPASVASVSGALTTAIRCAAAAVSVATVTAVLTTAIALTAAPSANATASASLTTAIRCAAAASSVATVTATLASPSESIFSTNYTDTGGTDSSASYELGVKFQSTVNGFITGIRFWQVAGETATSHTGRLWDSGGTSLGTCTITSGTVPGWQQGLFGSPIAITANTTYTASADAVNQSPGSAIDFYPATAGGLATSQGNGNHLSTVADGGNGVFNTTAGSFPSSAFGNTNYWRDVVFTTSAGSGAVLAATPSAVASVSAALSTAIRLASTPTSVSTLTATLTASGAGAALASTATSVATAGVPYLRLRWDASTDPSATGYYVYWDTVSHAAGPPSAYANRIDVGTRLEWFVYTLTAGTNYYLNVTAYDGAHDPLTESLLGGEVFGVPDIGVALDSAIQLASNPSAVSTVNATLTSTAAALAAAPVAISTVSAALTTQIRLAANTTAVSTVTAALNVLSLNASPASVATVTASLSTAIRLVSANAAQPTVTANLTAPVTATSGGGSVGSGNGGGRRKRRHSFQTPNEVSQTSFRSVVIDPNTGKILHYIEPAQPFVDLPPEPAAPALAAIPDPPLSPPRPALQGVQPPAPLPAQPDMAREMMHTRQLVAHHYSQAVLRAHSDDEESMLAILRALHQ